MKGFTQSLRTELLHEGSNVRVTMVHLPAVNTPQFEWTKSRLPCQALPVPPIYQPEVAARAIYFAAHSNRREVQVGGSTVFALLGNKIAPGFADWYLANVVGYSGQQTNEPADPNRPHNLWEPVKGDRGAHGRYDARAYRSSPQVWANTHRGLVALAGAGLAGVLLAAASRGKKAATPEKAARKEGAQTREGEQKMNEIVEATGGESVEAVEGTNATVRNQET